MDHKLNLPVDCAELIFSHLSGNDLLKCTLVSPQWNDFVESTRSCMKKIKVTGDTYCARNCRRHNPIKIFLRESKRKYECLELHTHDLENLPKYLEIKGRKWSSITLYLMFFEMDSTLFGFLKTIKSSIKKLDIKSNFTPEGIRLSQNTYE